MRIFVVAHDSVLAQLTAEIAVLVNPSARVEHVTPRIARDIGAMATPGADVIIWFGSVNLVGDLDLVRARARESPLIFIGAGVVAGEESRARDAGACAYLRLPFELDELIAAIEHATRADEAMLALVAPRSS